MSHSDCANALLACQQILEQQPESATAYLRMGELLEAQGQVAKAIHAYKSAIALQPDFAEAYAYVADLYSQTDRLTDAIENYQQALMHRPNWAELHFNLGNARLAQQDLSGAVASYQQAIAHAPNYAKAFYNLAVVMDRQGMLREAVQAYKQVIVLQPNNLNAHSNLGCLLVKQGKFPEALQILHHALSLEANRADLHNNLGLALLGMQQTGAAIASFSCAVQLQPGMPLALHNLGKAWQSVGYHEQAMTCLTKAIEHAPGNELLYADCSFSLMAMRELDRAFFYLSQGLEVNLQGQQFVDNYCLAVSQITAKDEVDLARIACVKFLKVLQKFSKPTSEHDLSVAFQYLRDIYSHFGNIYFDFGDYGQAEHYYRQALALKPETAELYIHLGDCFVKQKRSNDAVLTYQIAWEIQPDRPEILFKMGQTLEQLQQFEQAIAYYQRVWQMGGVPVNGLDGLDRSDGITDEDSEEHHENIKGIYLTFQDWLAGDSPLLVQVQAPMTPVPPRKVCGGLNCVPCLKQVFQWFEPIHIGNDIYRCSHEQFAPSPSLSHPLFVAQIPKGKAWIVPNQNYWKVCNAIATITADNYLIADLSRDYPGQLPICQEQDPTQHLLFWQDRLPPLKFMDGSVAVLSGLSGNVYFHWMVDVLPRLEVLRHQGINWTDIDWFMVSSCRSPFQQKTLEILGIPQHKILESDRYPHIQAERLVVPSFAGHLGWLSDWALRFLRKSFLSKALTALPSNSQVYPERIYISRAKAKYRKIFNESAVIDILAKYGFISVALESMSFLEQVALFANAKAIVAPHGSGLTNLIFCNSDTKVVEIFSPHYVRPYFWAIAQQLQLEHYYLLGEEFRSYPLRQLMYQSPLVEDISIDLSKLQKTVELII
jgi:tetratricopeptide (TPR) repeat protein/capsular polysaccharide biosynthesis protein